MTGLVSESKYAFVSGTRPAVGQASSREWVGRAASVGAVLVVGVVPPRGVAHQLRAAGFSVSFARSAFEAERFVLEHVPAAVLLGPSGDLDPWRLLRRFRAEERLAYVAVFVATPLPGGLRPAHAIAAGADDVFDARDDSNEGTRQLVARIVSRVARLETLVALACRDPLTGLHSRRYADDRLPAEVARAWRARADLSLALVDLDGFRKVNEVRGPGVGDALLATFAEALRANLRSYDIVCRWGGDQFIVLLPGCNSAGARSALEEFRHSRAVAADGEPIAFSCGIAHLHPAGEVATIPRPELGRARTNRDLPPNNDSQPWNALFEAARRDLLAAKSARSQRAAVEEGPTHSASGPRQSATRSEAP
jgi:diguanylate cyclase (GGDEF)-like protein